MNRRRFEFWLTVIGLLGFLAGALVGALLVTQIGGGMAGPRWPPGLGIGLGLAALLWLAVLAWVGQRLMAYLFTARRMAEDVDVIATVHPDHRVAETGPAELVALARAVNRLAERYQQALAEEEEAIRRAQAELRMEHNRLVSLLAQWPQGVLVCNPAGEILLYNPAARSILGAPLEPGNPDLRSYVGLGRSVFTLLERSVLEQALAGLRAHLEAGRPPPVRTFVARAANGRFVRVRMAPILDEAEAQGGFILSLEDVSAQLETSSRRDRLVDRLTRHMRSGLANLRAAIETLEAFPEADEATRRTLQQVIAQEAIRLSELLDETLQEYADALRTRWRMEEIPAEDLVQALAHGLRREGPLEVTAELEEAWLRVDTFALVDVLVRLRRTVQARAGARLPLVLHAARYRQGPREDVGEAATSGRAERDAGYLRLVLTWPQGLKEGQEQGNGRGPGGGSEMPGLDEVMEYHGGASWWERDEETGATRLVVLLPLAPGASHPAGVGGGLEVGPRPEYYDFDLLFRRPGQRAALDAMPLRELRYTVFDTETTGLDPETDVPVSISGVRIVNGRLLHGEIFDELADPQRPIPRGASRVHGIRDEMVVGCPPVAEVVRRFHRFAEDSVLVGHNVAFDMRLLENHTAEAGVRFDQPVLDTLLLSAVLHPDETDHSLEAAARRLGVPVEGRHTSLGDALTTARVFLRQLALLEARGIRTLGQAREAAEQTFFARIRYG